MKTQKRDVPDDGFQYMLRAQETAKSFAALEAAGGMAPSIVGARAKKKRKQINKHRVNSAELQRSRILKDLKSELPKVATKFW